MTKYLNFSRRAQRSEYWAVLIIGWILAAILSIVTVAVMILDGAFLLLGAVIMIIGLILLCWAMLATTASRCRDAGINPWWTAASLIPYIGFVVMIVVGCLNTQSAVESK